MSLSSRKTKSATFCWSTLRSCEFNRNVVIRERIGKPGQCTPQTLAHCMELVDHNIMSRQTLCSGTENDCLTRREFAIANPPPAKKVELSTCRPLKNEGPYTYSDEFAPAEPD